MRKPLLPTGARRGLQLAGGALIALRRLFHIYRADSEPEHSACLTPQPQAQASLINGLTVTAHTRCAQGISSSFEVPISKATRADELELELRCALFQDLHISPAYITGVFIPLGCADTPPPPPARLHGAPGPHDMQAVASMARAVGALGKSDLDALWRQHLAGRAA